MSVQDDITRIVWNFAVPPHTSVSIDTSSHDVERRVEPVTEHDGKLDNVGTLTVKFEQLSRGQVVEISEDPKHWLWFSPQQALSLLAWLRQEEDKLKKLAKEQAE